MSVKEGIEYFIKPSLENIKVLFLGEPLSIINDLLPKAIIYYYNNDNTLNFPIDYFDIIIDHDYLIYTGDLRAFEPIYKLLKFDGIFVGIGYDKDNIGLSKDYIFLARYSLFNNFIFYEKNGSFVVRIKKYNDATTELKKQYTEKVRKKLARLLHRIENNLYIDNNVEELAMLCEENKIEKTYLDNFIDNAIIYKDRLINNICGNNEISERNVQRVRDVLDKGEYDSEHKVAFILCVNNDELYDEALLYLSDLIVPDGYGVEIIDIRNATSMCSGYNHALKLTEAKYKVYIHQDVFICNKHFIEDILRIFENHNIGCIGLAGASKLPKSGVWWRCDTRCGKVIHENEYEECNKLDFGYINGEYKKVEALDGFMLVTQYDVAWREDLFTGWHFYDISMCMEMKKKGYDVVVANQGKDYWAIHSAGTKMLDPAYEDYRKIFLNEYCNG